MSINKSDNAMIVEHKNKKKIDSVFVDRNYFQSINSLQKFLIVTALGVPLPESGLHL